MVVTNPLKLLTVAALALPLTTIYASDEEATFQYGHYEDGARNLINAQSGFKPIQVDSIQTNTKLKLSDRVRLAFNYTQDTWSGATPITTAPLAFSGNRQRIIAPKILSGASPYLNNNNIFVDKNFNPLQQDSKTGEFTKNLQLVHTLSTASPETRKQGDLRFGYDWDEASLDIGAGTSAENDYNSSFGNIGGRLDFNQKLTSVNFGTSYTTSDTEAMLDHDAVPYIEKSTFGTRVKSLPNGVKLLIGSKQDWSGSLGVTQVLNKSTLVEGSVSYTASNGYMSNPYKTMAVLFVDPAQKIGKNGQLNGSMLAFLEQRPEERQQWTENLRYVQHIDALDAALHFDYRFYHDDWGIQAHTISSDWIQPLGDGWSITPRVRYYSQNAANFYSPYLVSKQAVSKSIYNPETDKTTTTKYDPKLLPQNYSSDYRLSGYGALSGGLTVTKKFAKGLELQAGAEYYTHAGSLKLGGGGEGNYSDFDGYLVNAALKVDLAALSIANSTHNEHANHVHHHGAGAPAGIMFDHVLPKAGDFMVGYRYQYADQAGGSMDSDDDKNVVNNACAPNKCYVTPQEMSMNMHMLDLMYAPTDWLTLMLMPQFMDMHMTMRPLDGAPETPSMTTPLGAAIIHAGHEHTTGGVGDTGMYALFNLFKTDAQQINLSLGMTAPTGDAAIQLRDTHRVDLGFIHYGMQLGSGTWDFKPAVTYTANIEDWSFGAQLNGTKRMESYNKAGFAFGDIFQATAWGSYSWTNCLATSVRGVYTLEGALRGAYRGVYHQIGS
ncbi:MAG: DUF3570 domain-containing protein, partial [Methylococcales bacterium]|nr:DUF3570 domain-containing protein [Methylococcales bacterium]